MNIALQERIWDAELKRSHREMLVLMSWYAREDGGSIFPSLATLAHKLDKDERHVRRLMRELESAGYIECTDSTQARRKAYVYRIVGDALKPKRTATEAVTLRGTFLQPGHSEPSPRTFCCSTPDILGGAADIQMSPELAVERAVERAEEIEKNTDQVWKEVLKQLESRINRHSFDIWVKPMRPLGIRDRSFVFGVPDADYVEICERFKPAIVEELIKAGLEVSGIRFSVHNEAGY